MNKEIPIFFTIDNGYAPYLAVALNSAIKNADKSRRYKAIVLHEGLEKENAQKLMALQKDFFRIEILPMKANFEMLDDRMSNRLRCDYFTLTIYFRLFIPSMFPEYDKGIYIDSDVVITDDIAKLYDIETGDNLIGACNDLSIADAAPLVEYTEQAIGVCKEEYINSGVLLMNLKKMRECDLEGHFLRLLSEYHFDSVAPDQDYLNAICNGRIYYLDSRWDAMPNEARPPIERPGIIHYNLFSKPWHYDGVQYADRFWEYARDCGFTDEIKKEKDGFSTQEKKADSECLARLINRAIAISQEQITFKKMAEKGVKIRL